MDYSNYIEQIKQDLGDYSGEDEQLKSLYQSALASNDAAYQSARKELNDRYTASKNKAYAQSKLSERDTAQQLALRGLSSSGEGVQAKLNSNIALGNAFNELASSYESGLSEAMLQKNKSDSEALADYTSGKIASDRYRSELALSIAKQQRDDEREDEETARETAAQQAKEKREAEAAAASAAEKAEKERLAAEAEAEKERLAAEKEAEAERLEAEKAAAAEQKAADERSAALALAEEAAHDALISPAAENAHRNPSVASKQLAKNIISASCSGVSVKSEFENAKVRIMLESIGDDYNFDDEYRESMDFELKSSGYTDISFAEAEAVISCKEARGHYNEWFKTLYNRFKSARGAVKNVQEAAHKYAEEMQQCYIYTHCSSYEAFEIAWSKMGFSKSSLDNFIKGVEKGGTLVLGSDISYD